MGRVTACFYPFVLSFAQMGQGAFVLCLSAALIFGFESAQAC